MLNAIKLILFLLFICTQSIFAYDSIEVLNPNIKIEKTGYFKTDKELSPEQAYKIAINGNLSQLPQKATSFGFDKNTYWFLFEVSTKSNKQFVLDLRNFVAEYAELFTFQDGKVAQKQISGYLVPIDKRALNTFPIRFNLEESSQGITYILKIKSNTPQFTAFAFGTEPEANILWDSLSHILIFSFGIFVALTFYNFFLYFLLQDKSYLYYCVYMSGLFLFDFMAIGYASLLPDFMLQNARLFLTIFLNIKLIGLTLFAIHFLKLQEYHNKLRLTLLLVLCVEVALSLSMPFGFKQHIFAFSLVAFYIFLIVVGIKSYTSGFKPAMFYIIATCVGIGFMSAFMFMNQGIGIEFGFLSVNFINIAMVWDLIFSSLALAYRIKILRQNNELAQQMLQAHSRFSTLGETIGNIAHQWRQPLTELSLINTYIDVQLRFNGEISKDDLLKSTKESDAIIKKLSSIIDMFYSFFDKNSIDDKFELSSVISDVVEFMRGQFDANDIVCNIKNQSSCVIAGNKEEFFQAFLIILNNAKDALVQNKTFKPIVDIIIGSNETSANITIEDNGGGIKIYDIQKIFEPYVSSKGLNGMGIGLFIVKNIIENKLSGAISAKNSKDGAIFTINLPTVKQTKELNFEPNR